MIESDYTKLEEPVSENGNDTPAPTSEKKSKKSMVKKKEKLEEGEEPGSVAKISFTLQKTQGAVQLDSRPFRPSGK